MKNKNVLELLARLEEGTSTPQEREILERVLFDHIEQVDSSRISDIDIELLERVDRRLRSRLSVDSVRKSHFRTRHWWSVAVAVLLVSVIAYFWLAGFDTVQRYTTQSFDIGPGGNNAVLLMGDGTKLPLREEPDGIVIGDGTIRYRDGSLAFQKHQYSELRVSEKHAVQTPKGGQYKMELPDGSQVWLNSATTLWFDNDFENCGERVVEVVGEAFFDVVQNGKPFKIVTRNQEIRVLGTQFNVNNYGDDPFVRTTLVEGKVWVTPLTNIETTAVPGFVLLPGQQSIVGEFTSKVIETDLEQVIDWKNGDFVFNQQGVKEIMQKVGRWYDIDVVFAENLDPKQTFTGQISRSRNLSDVLRNLSATGQVTFKFLDDNTLKVLQAR